MGGAGGIFKAQIAVRHLLFICTFWDNSLLVVCKVAVDCWATVSTNSYLTLKNPTVECQNHNYMDIPPLHTADR